MSEVFFMGLSPLSLLTAPAIWNIPAVKLYVSFKAFCQCLSRANALQTGAHGARNVEQTFRRCTEANAEQTVLYTETREENKAPASHMAPG